MFIIVPETHRLQIRNNLKNNKRIVQVINFIIILYYCTSYQKYSSSNFENISIILFLHSEQIVLFRLKVCSSLLNSGFIVKSIR